MSSGTPGSTLERLDDQIAWYDRKSVNHQRWYKGLKVTQMVAAAVIPVIVTLKIGSMAAAVLGALIVLLEGLQGLYQFQSNWTAYRSTAEELKHEKYLHLAQAGPYATAANPDAMLAERVEALVSQEHAKWLAAREHSEPKTQT